MNIHSLASHYPSHKINLLRMAQLSVQRVNFLGLMSDHQPDSFELSLLAAVVCSCFHPYDVIIALNSDHSPLLDPSIYQASAGISLFPLCRLQRIPQKQGWGHVGGSTYSSEPKSTHISGDSGLVERVLVSCN